MKLYKNKPRNYELNYKNIKPRAKEAPKMNDVTFTTCHQDKPPTVFILPGAWLEKCPHCILLPEHYKPDGSCLCYDEDHQAMLAKERKERTAKLLKSQTKGRK